MDTIEAIKTIEEVFAYNLRKLRGAKTQAEVCEATGIPDRTYQSMEEGVIPKKDENRQKLIDYYGGPFTKFFIDPDLPSPPSPSQEDSLSAAAQAIEIAKKLRPELCSALAALEEPELSWARTGITNILTQARLLRMKRLGQKVRDIPEFGEPSTKAKK